MGRFYGGDQDLHLAPVYTSLWKTLIRSSDRKAFSRLFHTLESGSVVHPAENSEVLSGACIANL